MNLKLLGTVFSVFVLASCAQVQEGLQTTMNNIGNDFKNAMKPGQATGSPAKSGGKRGT